MARFLVRVFLTLMPVFYRQTFGDPRMILGQFAQSARQLAENTMTAIGITHDRRQTLATPAQSRSFVLKVLLLSGFLSSFLYIATDLLGGMRYDGYSFASQAISELGAIGAPSPRNVAAQVKKWRKALGPEKL